MNYQIPSSVEAGNENSTALGNFRGHAGSRSPHRGPRTTEVGGVAIPVTSGTAMAVAPLQNGESAVWITTEGAVFYCVHLVGPDPE